MNLLELLFEKHKTWINYVVSFGSSKDEAEDFVQDMYIKIYDYSQKTNNSILYNEDEVNYYFVFVVLKNLYTDSFRKKKLIKVDLVDTFIDEDEYNEQEFNSQLKLAEDWETDLKNQIQQLTDYKQKLILSYIKFVYDNIYVNSKRVSELSRETGISYWSLRKISLIIKDQIQNGK